MQAKILQEYINEVGKNIEEYSNLNGYSLVENTNQPKKQWTIMVYMAADNNLESAAVEDFNEMEASKYDRDKMNVIVLFDRNNLKDCSDQDEWEGARLYEICRDENGMNNSLYFSSICS